MEFPTLTVPSYVKEPAKEIGKTALCAGAGALPLLIAGRRPTLLAAGALTGVIAKVTSNLAESFSGKDSPNYDKNQVIALACTGLIGVVLIGSSALSLAKSSKVPLNPAMATAIVMASITASLFSTMFASLVDGAANKLI